MLRLVVAVIIGSAMLRAEGMIEEKYAVAANCRPCHQVIVKDWESSLHAKSHYSKNELYRRSLEYVAKKKYKTKEQVEVHCAKCHNPRIAVKSAGDPYGAAMGFKDAAVEKALNAEYLKDGVNCIVCHNVKSIDFSKDPYKRGAKSITWGENHVMVGPYKDAKSPYHDTMYRPFFKEEPDRLCFVCHYNTRSTEGIQSCSTGEEYVSVKSEKRCVDCHMGATHEGHSIQSRVSGEFTDKVRHLKSHLFMGVRNGNIMPEALKVSARAKAAVLKVQLENLTPHKVPTAYGGREINILVTFNGADGILKRVHERLGARYVDNRGRETLPHLAAEVKTDNRLEPLEVRSVDFAVPSGAMSADIAVEYRLVSKAWVETLELKDPTYLNAYPVKRLKISF